MISIDESIDQLRDMIVSSNRIVVFTGAGISSESGIPTYRGAGGIWSKYDPNIYANINTFMQDPTYYWHYFKDERYPSIKNAKPNKTHHAVVKLEKQGKIHRVITQNIDGLHQLAGSSYVIELHGTTRNISCLRCKKQYSIDDVFKKLEKELPPYCTCGGHLKTNTILFGEALPQQALLEAEAAAQTCDLFLVLGSSLVVYPAAQLPILAKKNKALLIIINIDSTPLDDLADIVINDNAARVLSSLDL
jgi:NAD-dependent deacetylase